MPAQYKKPIYNSKKLSLLARLRDEAGLTQDEVARFFELEGPRRRQTVGTWELGYYRPALQNRDRFKQYLLDKLGLRHDRGRYRQIWNDIMVGEWKWEPLEEFAQTDWGEAPEVSVFYGRDQELAELEQWILNDSCRLIGILGQGGIGKTALVTRLAIQLQDEFEYVFWRSLKDLRPPEEILAECLQFLTRLRRSELPDKVGQHIRLLIDHLRKHRCLIVLDNVEAVLRSGDELAHFLEGYEDLGELIQRLGEAEHRSCVLLTSRDKLRELAELEGATESRPRSPVQSLQLRGLDLQAVRAILREKRIETTDEQLQKLVTWLRGNPLALRLIGSIIREVFNGNVEDYLTEIEENQPPPRILELVQEQFDRLPETGQEVMYWLAIGREPVARNTLKEDLISPGSQSKLPALLNTLQERSLVEVSGEAFTLQPVIMRYVTERLVNQTCNEIETEQIAFFNRYALIKAQARDYIRNSQSHFILEPVSDRLCYRLGQRELIHKLKQALVQLQQEPGPVRGYTAGNVFNLLLQLKVNVRGYDFSHLSVWQAYLKGKDLRNERNVDLRELNFAYADLARSALAETFGSIVSVAFSPDGKRLAAGSVDDSIYIWGVGGKLLTTCKGHSDWVRAVAFSPDGNTLASGGGDRTVRLWDAKTGECLKTLSEHRDRIRALAFSPDGETLASGSGDNTICLWSIKDIANSKRRKTLIGHTDLVRAVAFSPTGEILASGGRDKIVRLWDTRTGKKLTQLPGQSDLVRAVAFSPPDGEILAIGTGDGMVRLWDVRTRQYRETRLKHTGILRAIAFSSDGRTLASVGDDGVVQLWDVARGDLLRELEGHKSRIWSVTSVSNSSGALLATGSDDQSIRIWDLETGYLHGTIQGYSNPIWSVGFSNDNLRLVSGGGDQLVRVWDIETGECIKELRGHRNRVRSVALARHGEIAATASDEGRLRVWDIESGRCLKTLEGHRGSVRRIAFDPDGHTLASGGEDKTVCLWDLETGRCWKRLPFEKGAVWSVAFSPDGRLLAIAGDDRDVQMWDVEGQLRYLLEGNPSTKRIFSVAFNWDGEMLATGSDDEVVRVWNLISGEAST